MARYHSLFCALFGGLLAVPAPAAIPAPRSGMSHSCPADPALAILIAGSDLVVTGRMDLPAARLAEEAKKAAPGYVDVAVQIETVIKGSESGRVTVRVYPGDAPYKSSNAALMALSGVPAILFLQRVDAGPAGYYFAGASPEAARPATARDIVAIKAETVRQTGIASAWRVDTRLPHFMEVRSLIAQLGKVSGTSQQRVFDRLEKLGMAGVPAIIAQMDDRRPLRTQEISLVNHAPDAWEGIRHYGPEQVVDGLDAVLNQITGQSFGSIENGGSDRERDAAVAGWRVYAADLACR